MNNATRGSVLCVLARTTSEGGPRGFSVLLVDKRTLTPGSWRPLPKVPTHGIRGADISGIVLDGAYVDREALIGPEGSGIETVLKSLQLTRTMCASLSLGAADHGLRIALDFARKRRLYGRQLAELPQARALLAAAVADVLTHESLALVASRMVHTTTGELSVVAAVTKYLLPTGTEDVLTALGELLGARAFLVSGPGTGPYGMFQKVERDHRIVGLFDGNTLVNLNSLILQFRSLVRHWRRRTPPADGMRTACDLAAPLPEFDPAELELAARRGAAPLAALPAWTAVLRERTAEEPALKDTAELAERLLTVTDRVHEEMGHLRGCGDRRPRGGLRRGAPVLPVLRRGGVPGAVGGVGFRGAGRGGRLAGRAVAAGLAGAAARAAGRTVVVRRAGGTAGGGVRAARARAAGLTAASPTAAGGGVDAVHDSHRRRPGS
ncbi:acyl-CoA dehydrogenase family protein [Streptomyces sp. GLT-R25]